MRWHLCSCRDTGSVGASRLISTLTEHRAGSSGLCVGVNAMSLCKFN